ncbi:MAG: GspH/FimT family pseudopilin [Rhodospirillaceae bacterium]
MQRAIGMRGFTLVEALAVMAVASILITLGVTGMRELILNQRVKTASFDIYSSLTYARSEAITRNRNVTVTPSGGNWANGWSIADSSGTTLRTQNAMTNITITGPASVTYNGIGRLNASVSSISITAPGVTGSNQRCITIDLSGRPVVKTQACS